MGPCFETDRWRFLLQEPHRLRIVGPEPDRYQSGRLHFAPRRWQAAARARARLHPPPRSAGFLVTAPARLCRARLSAP
jgi:hypothetical protein